MAQTNVTPEKIEEAASEYVFPPLRSVGVSTLDPDDWDAGFWRNARNFFEEPSLQDLVDIASCLGASEAGKMRKRLLYRLAQALYDTKTITERPGLESAWPPGTASDLVLLLVEALTPEGHEEALKGFEAWEARQIERELNEAREAAPGWFERGLRS